MRKLGILIVVLLLVAGGGYYGLEIYPSQRMRSELDQSFAKNLPGYIVSYKDASYSPLSHAARIGGLVIESPKDRPAAQSFIVTIDEILMSNPSLSLADSWNQDAASPGSVTPDAALPLADRIAVKGVNFRGAAVVSFESASIDKPRIYPWALLQPGTPSLNDISAIFTLPQHQPPQLADFIPMLRFEAAIVLAVGYDGYDAEKLKTSIHVPAMPNSPAMDLTYQFARMTGKSFDRGTFAEGGIEGLSAASAAFGAFTVDRVTMSEMDLRQPATLVLSGATPTAAMLDGLKIGGIEYSGMTAHPTSGTPVAVGTFALSKLAFSQGMPISAALSWSGAHFSAKQIPVPQVIDAFDKLGLDSATLSIGFAYDLDLAQKHLAVHDTMVKIDELGTLALGAEFSDVVPGLVAQNDARLVHLKLRYDDASLAERALKAGAALSGADPEALRQQLVGMITQQSVILGKSPEASAATQAVVAFLKAPKSLAIELAPPVPLAAATLQNAALMPPDKVVSSFGFSVTANQ